MLLVVTVSLVDLVVTVAQLEDTSNTVLFNAYPAGAVISFT
jgi:hypothetical protein